MVTTFETKASVASEELRSLYDSDFALWVEATAQHLQNRNFQDVDLENLIEEVLDLSRRSRHKLKSLLRRLFEYLLKLKYWQLELDRNQNHWRGKVFNFRQQIQDELQSSPSLRGYLQQILDECYLDACESVSITTGLPLSTFPKATLASVEQVLDKRWFG
ncbi:DUF29 domain-containing protein [Dolichospermum sp. ST_con]|nr:DUF29 domain-containing protein [Dolichospermum sp. ST_con]